MTAASPPDPAHGSLLDRADGLLRSCAEFAATVPSDWPDDAARQAGRIATAADEFLETARQPTGNWCHDLRNKLNGILGPCQMLLRHPPPGSADKIQPQLTEIRREARVALETVNALAPPDGGEAPLAVPVTAAAPAHSTEGPSLLVVDDDHEARSVIAGVLRDAGYTVWEASDGQQAIRFTEAVPLDLMLLDHNLPGVDGHAVLTRLRAGGRMAAVPVLMVSGVNDLDRVVGCIQAGADDFLTKPVQHVLLLAKVRAFLLRRRQQLATLEQFFPTEIARQLIDRPDLADEAKDAEVTVLFSDIRGFSRISERAGTVLTLQFLRAVMGELSECVLAHRGVLVDLVGDGLMAVWGAPTSQPDHAALACTAALDMIARLPGLTARWRDRLGEPVEITVGLNSGLARVGNTGTERKFKYGVLGNTVNTASRIQGTTKYLQAPIVVSQATVDRLGGRFESRRLADVRVVNIREPLRLHELVPASWPGWPERKRDYEQALGLFEERKLSEAARLLSGLIATHGAGGPELALMARTMAAMVDPDVWNPIADLPGK